MHTSSETLSGVGSDHLSKNSKVSFGKTPPLMIEDSLDSLDSNSMDLTNMHSFYNLQDKPLLQ